MRELLGLSLGFSGGICSLQWQINPILCWHRGNWVEGPDMDPFHVSAADATHLRSGVLWVLPKLFRLNTFVGP